MTCPVGRLAARRASAPQELLRRLGARGEDFVGFDAGLTAPQLGMSSLMSFDFRLLFLVADDVVDDDDDVDDDDVDEVVDDDAVLIIEEVLTGDEGHDGVKAKRCSMTCRGTSGTHSVSLTPSDVGHTSLGSAEASLPSWKNRLWRMHAPRILAECASMALSASREKWMRDTRGFFSVHSSMGR
jgi:hypothetical protein